MTTYTRNLSLDVSLRGRKRAEPLLLGQGDKRSKLLMVEITEDGQPLDLTQYDNARLVMLLPDGETYYGVECSTKEGSLLTFTVDESEAAQIPGSTEVAYVSLLRGDEEIASTERFGVRVLRGAETGRPAQSWDSAIAKSRERAEEAAEKIEEILAGVEDATIQMPCSVANGVLRVNPNHADVIGDSLVLACGRYENGNMKVC